MINPTPIYQSLPKVVKKPVRNWLKNHQLLRWYFAENSYLRRKGWMKSEEVGGPVNQDEQPIPWYTYPATDFIKPKLKNQFRVFEFGSGNSSLWYNGYVSEVIAVEDSEDWMNYMKSCVPKGVDIVYQPDLDEYPDEILGRGEFDIVVIDGRVRGECLAPSLRCLKDDGVIVLDDFERWDPDDWKVLTQQGFRPITFFGPKAHRLTESCTAILYRNENCLEI